MEQKNNLNGNYLKIGVPSLILGIVGILLIFFFLSIPALIIFLLTLYPFVIAFIFGIIYTLRGFNKVRFLKVNLLTTVIIIIGAFFMTLCLDILVPFIVRIL